jgi:hypothetical protein
MVISKKTFPRNLWLYFFFSNILLWVALDFFNIFFGSSRKIALKKHTKQDHTHKFLQNGLYSMLISQAGLYRVSTRVSRTLSSRYDQTQYQPCNNIYVPSKDLREVIAGIYQCWSGINLYWYQLVLALLRGGGYQTLGHIRMVSSLIPVFIPVLIPVSDGIYIRPILVYTCFYTSFNTRCIYLPHTGQKSVLDP